MNRPPTEFVRVTADALQSFIDRCLKLAGLAEEHAALMARLLTECDLRGVHSHGVNRLPMYIQDLREGKSNPAPTIRVVKQEPSLAIVDGDGGIGYLPTVQVTEMAIQSAHLTGVGVGVVRHIGHYGAAGIYTRMCAEDGCIGFSVQGNAGTGFSPEPVCTLGAPPMSFAFPGQQGPPVVVDFNTRFFGKEEMDLFERIPAAFFKSLGLTVAAKLLGGALAGQMLPQGTEIQRRYPSHAGGAFVLALSIDDFVPRAAFAEEVDRFHRDIAAQMEPMPGYERAQLPGAVEAELMDRYSREGIPISMAIKEQVETAVRDLGVKCPWEGETR